MDDKQMNKVFSNGETLIDQLNEELATKVKRDQNKFLDDIFGEFLDKLERDENGLIENNDRNRRLMSRIDNVFDDYSKHQSTDLIKLLLGGAGSIFDFNSDYYGMLDGKAKVKEIKPRVKDMMGHWLGLTGDKVEPNGYLDRLVKSDDVRTTIKNASMKIVVGQVGYEQARKDMQLLIAGDKKNLGAFEKYHRNYTYDLFSQVDRAVGRQMGEELGMNYAIYAGDIIKKSREFCIQHAGNVYHISEIVKFDPKVAIPPNYDPITDLGGYGCRHVLRWISLALAKRKRPEVVALFEK